MTYEVIPETLVIFSEESDTYKMLRPSCLILTLLLAVSPLVLAKEAVRRSAKSAPRPAVLDPFEQKLREAYGEAAEGTERVASLPTREELILAGRRKASYRVIFSGYQPGFDFAPYFKATIQEPREKAPSFEQLRGEWGDRGALRFSVLQAIIESQDNMVRAEIEDPKTQDGARALLQLSLLRLRVMGPEQSALWLASEGEVWQRVLQNIPFEEASRKSMLFASEMRSLIWQEMLMKIKTSAKTPAFPWTEWAERLRALRLAWPIDRVLLSEARKSLPPAGMLVATHVAAELQKDPFRKVADVRQRVKGGAMKKLDVLDAIWGQVEVSRMEAETDELSEIRLRLAFQRYRQQKSHDPKDISELVTLGFIDSLPLCFKTRESWKLTQVGGNEGP